MDERQIRELVRRTVEQMLPPILLGQIVSNEDDNRSTIQRFSNEPPRANARSILPFGIASKAPAGTPAFIVPAGNDQTNQNIIGHFDGNRPQLADGDVAIYDAHGHVLYLSSGKIQLGSEGSSENLVLGKVFQTMMETLLQALATHTHPSPGAPPTNASAFTSLKSSPIADGAILSGVAFTEKGGA